MSTPKIGNWVRVNEDRGTGITGAVAAVAAIRQVSDQTLLTVDVHGSLFDVWAEGVHVVIYDDTTRTWKKVP